jgi:D-3-phosphoglycerate dehydrogenase
MITKLASALGEKNINIANMMNKSRGEVAYTMFDIDSPICEGILEQLEAIEGVFKVRVVK